MKCEDCFYYFQDVEDKWACCHFEGPGGWAPCEQEDDYEEEEEDEEMIQYVYLVYDECHGFRGVYATEERARKEVENISKNEYKLNEEEIFPEEWENGNELCYYVKEVIIYD